MNTPIKLTIGEEITASIFKRPEFTAKITGFGTHNGKPVIDLDNNKFIYHSQLKAPTNA